MRTLRQRKYLFALLAILALFAACKGESPTVPPIGTGGSGSGGSGTPPPVGSSVVITASNLNPISGSVVALTITVSQNNQPVPNGTAVELSTTRGNFVDPTSAASLGSATILTTNNGQVLVNLTSSTAGAALIRAVVNNVAAQLTVNFQVGTVTPGGGGTAPTVTSVAPTFGPPSGGQTVTINGTNFRAPARVIFDFGAPIGMKEAFVVSVTPTQIVVLTPAVDLAAAQTLPATIKVIVGAGSTGEQSVTVTTPFNFQAQVLTPIITTLSPASGPIDGGTRTTIFGSGFQAPVQVFFGSAEAQVLTTTFDQIIVISPTGRDTNPDGSGPATGPIPVKVINIASNTQVTLAAAFRYTPKMQITAVGPTIGPGTGGTRVTIDGVGFNDPVAVTIGGVAAQPIKVSGTQIIALTLPLPQVTCGGTSGPISVTNIDNGDSATAVGLTFTYTAPKPTIVAIVGTQAGGGSGTANAGTNVDITVNHAQPGTNKFTIGDKTLFGTPQSVPDGVAPVTFSVVLPTSFTFPSGPCTVGGVAGTAPQSITVSVVYLNVETGCTDTAANALTINPPNASCALPPSATAVPATGSTLTATSAVGTPVSPVTARVTVSNAASTPGNQISPLTVSAAISGTNSTEFTVAPTSSTIASGSSTTFQVTFTPTATGARTGTLTLTTNDPAHPTFTYTLSGTGTP